MSTPRPRQLALTLTLAALQAAIYLPMVRWRLADLDEGLYLYVARLAIEGQRLYQDFYYPQTYFLPYLYGAPMALFGPSWYGGRLLSAGFAIALGLLVFHETSRRTGSRRAGALALVLLTLSSLAFGWFPLVKGLVVPAFLAFAAGVVAVSGGRRRWLLCGLLAGLAIASRVYVGIVVVALLVELFRGERSAGGRARSLSLLALGGGLALLPTLLFLFPDPGKLYFNVVGSQLVRSGFDHQSWWAQKTLAARILLGVGTGEGAVTFQTVLLLVVCLAAWAARLRAREPFPLGTLMGLGLLVASFVPTPVYTQYFAIVLPFAIVDAVDFGTRLRREGGALAAVFLGAIVAAYLVVAPIDLYRWTGGERLAPGPAAGDSINWRLDTVRAVGRAIDRHLPPGDARVITFWPGYLVETRARVVAGLENSFNLEISRRVDPAAAARYRMMTYGELALRLDVGEAPVVALGNWTRGREWLLQHLERGGYRRIEAVEKAEIYTRAPAPPAPLDAVP